MNQLGLATALEEFTSFLAFPFEKNFVTTPYAEFCQNNWPLVLGVLTFYLSFCYFGQKIMATREAFNLKYTLAAWNALLCVFSFIGMMRTVPHLLSQLLSKSFEETVCS